MESKSNLESKKEFIKEYIRKRLSVDILDAEFVDAYIEKFQPKYKVKMFGANNCPELGQLLSTMYQAGELKRFACGLPKPNWQPGFPKWVYSYQLI